MYVDFQWYNSSFDLFKINKEEENIMHAIIIKFEEYIVNNDNGDDLDADFW